MSLAALPPARQEVIRQRPLTAWTAKVTRAAADELLQQIYERPLAPEFRGKKGITAEFVLRDHSPDAEMGERDQFDRIYSLAQHLQVRGLVDVRHLGITRFSVTTTFDREGAVNY